MKNEFEEAFLRRYITGVSSSTTAGGLPSQIKKRAACLLRMRCSLLPGQSVEWHSEDESHVVGVGAVQVTAASRRYVCGPRSVRWVLDVTFAGSDAARVAVNGVVCRNQQSLVTLSPGDVLQLDALSEELWYVEDGGGAAADMEDALSVPQVVSSSPFVVAAAAANADVYERIAAKVKCLQDRMQLLAEHPQVLAKAVRSGNPAVTDPPTIQLVHRLDWCLTALDEIENKLTSKAPKKRVDRDTQTDSLRSSMLGSVQQAARHASLGGYVSAMNTRPQPAVDFRHPEFAPPAAASPSTHESPESAVLLCAAMHDLWVARHQLRIMCSQDASPSACGVLQQEVETLLHRNAELERRLTQRSAHWASLEAEVRILRESCRTDAISRDVAAQTLASILHQQQKTTGPRNRLSEEDELMMLQSVGSLLEYTTRLERQVRACDIGGQPEASAMEIELRNQLAALRAEGGIEVVVALQASLQNLMTLIGSHGYSSMSPWGP